MNGAVLRLQLRFTLHKSRFQLTQFSFIDRERKRLFKFFPRLIICPEICGVCEGYDHRICTRIRHRYSAVFGIERDRIASVFLRGDDLHVLGIIILDCNNLFLPDVFVAFGRQKCRFVTIYGRNLDLGNCNIPCRSFNFRLTVFDIGNDQRSIPSRSVLEFILPRRIPICVAVCHSIICDLEFSLLIFIFNLYRQKRRVILRESLYAFRCVVGSTYTARRCRRHSKIGRLRRKHSPVIGVADRELFCKRFRLTLRFGRKIPLDRKRRITYRIPLLIIGRSIKLYDKIFSDRRGRRIREYFTLVCTAFDYNIRPRLVCRGGRGALPRRKTKQNTCQKRGKKCRDKQDHLHDPNSSVFRCHSRFLP